MSERSKYALNGVYRCGNFAQHLAQNNFPTIGLGTLGGINGWYIRLEVIQNGTTVYPTIRCNNKPRLYIHYYFNILGKDGQSFFKFVDNLKLYETYGPRGHDMKILDILNQKNGYLVDGTLSIEYGIHINGIMGNYRIWKFNLNNKSFNSQHSLKIEYWDPNDRRLKTLYCHKQLLRFHSSLFQDEVTKFQTGGFEKLLIEKCFQAAHGVRVPFFRSVLNIAFLAHDNELRNVVHPLSIPIYYFENCMELGLRHYLARLINRLECLKDLKEVIQKLDMEDMSGETMKTFMAKIFKLNSTKGIYRIENFARHVRRHDSLRLPFGPEEGLVGWGITLICRTDGIAYPQIYRGNKPTFKLRYFFNVLKKDGSSSFKTYCQCTSKFSVCGLQMKIRDLLNSDNGYLDDGTLSIEYGVHVDGIQGNDGIWKFRFSDTFSVNENVLPIEYNPIKNRKVFYTPKQLLTIHNPQFKDQNVKFNAGLLGREQIEKCLQMAHGVRIQLDKDFLIVLMVAEWNQLRNVMQYADQQLVIKYVSPWEKLSDCHLYENCIRFGLRHSLANLVRHFTCVTDLKAVIQQLDIENMSGEAMKTLAAKIFDIGT